MNSRRNARIAIALMALLLAGCTERDAAELEIRNGTAFEKGTKRVYDGPVVFYYPDTGNEKRIYQQGSYRMGAKDGLWTTYKWTGEKETSSFKLGKLNGPVISYDSAGNVMKEDNYLNNQLNGISTVYDKSGETISQTYYKDGKQIEVVTKQEDSKEEGSQRGQSYWDGVKSTFKKGYF